MSILTTIGNKLTEWDKRRYYRKIENFFKQRNWYITLLEIQGADREYCIASLKLYNAGYQAKQSPTDVAICLLQSISIYKMCREKAVHFIRHATELLENEPDVRKRLLHEMAIEDEATPEQSDDEKLEITSQKNIDIINSVISQIMSELSIDTDLHLQIGQLKTGPSIQTKLGSFGDGHAQMNRGFTAMLVFAVFCICKNRHDSQYSTSAEYEKTKVSFAMQEIACSETMFKKIGLAVSEEKLIEGVSKNIVEIENHVAIFFKELKNGNTTTPDRSLINWYKAQTGYDELSGQPLTLRIREYSKFINNLLRANSSE